MRMLQLGMGWFPEQGGGLNRYYYDLVRALPAAGVECDGLVLGEGLAEQETAGRIRTYARSEASILARWSAGRKAVALAVVDRSYDVTAAHFAYYALPALGSLRKAPFVVHFHGPWAAESAAESASPLVVKAKAELERFVYSHGDRYVVLSEAFARVLSESYAVPWDKIRVVPGGIDASRFDIPQTKGEAREILGWPADRPIVVAVRRLVSRMGLEDLIDAVATIRRTHPEVLVMIAGKGRLQPELAARIEARGLAEHVRLLGYLPDEHLPLAYRAADLSVAPTLALEGFGLIAAEALAAGTPVLVTPVGGLPEVVRNLAPDLVLPGTGPAAVAEGIAGALSGALQIPDAAALQAYARAHYDWSSIAPMLRSVYEDAARR